MDIVVTIPKSEYDNDDKETEYLLNNPDAFQFWTLNKIPKDLNVGDRVYFVKNSKIDSSMNVFEIGFGTEHCDVTDRDWFGCILKLNDLEIYKDTIEIKGFQGYRYRWW